MSLIWTESFAGFRKGGVSLGDDLKAADYGVTGQGAEWHIVDDLIVPNRLVLTPIVFGENGGNVTLSRKLPPYTAPVIIGFSVYVPLTYTRQDADPTALLTFRIHEDISLEGSEVYRLRRDLSISLGTANPQNISRMVPGRVHYLEVRISLSEIRVWMDDVFVLQHTTIGKSPLGWSLDINEDDFGIGNIYVLNEDLAYPNVRLGRATRVIGDRPSADSEADFERPTLATSNAQVAGQDFLAEPSAVLQGTNVGDRDIYEVGGTSSQVTSTVHALAVKVRAMNADVVPRAISPLVEKDGAVSNGTQYSRFHYLEPFTNSDLLCAARVPGVGVAVGTQNGQVWFSQDGEHFDGIAEIQGASVTDMVAKSNALIAVYDNGKVVRINFSVTPPNVSVIETPSTEPLRAVAANDNRIIAVGDAGTVITSEFGEADTWFKRAIGSTANLTAVSFAGDHWLIAGSFSDASLKASLDDGNNWLSTTASKPSIAGPLRIRTWEGRTVVMGSAAVPVASRIAVVGWNSPFYAATKVGNLATPAACVDCIKVGDVFFFALADGTTLISEDALICHLGYPLDMEPLALTLMDDGRVLAVGKGGSMYLRAAMDNVTELPVLSGYVNGYAAVTTNPKTGVQWQPIDAANARVGVRIDDVPAYGDTGDYLLTETGLRVLDENGRKIILEDFTK